METSEAWLAATLAAHFAVPHEHIAGGLTNAVNHGAVAAFLEARSPVLHVIVDRTASDLVLIASNVPSANKDWLAFVRVDDVPISNISRDVLVVSSSSSTEASLFGLLRSLYGPLLASSMRGRDSRVQGLLKELNGCLHSAVQSDRSGLDGIRSPTDEVSSTRQLAGCMVAEGMRNV